MKFKNLLILIIASLIIGVVSGQTVIYQTSSGPSDPIILFHDDGSAEEGTNLEYEYVEIAVKFDSDIGKGDLNIEGIQFYMLQEGDGNRDDFNIRVWTEGPEGFPEDPPIFETTIPGNQPELGWNTFMFDEDIVVSEGYFYLGFMGPYMSEYSFGVDLSSSGWSTRFVEGDWYDEDGAYMIRAIVSESLGLEDEMENKLMTINSIYPNPFTNSFTIDYSISAKIDEIVDISIYDLTGKKIKTVINDIQIPGEYHVDCTLDDAPAGIYFCLYRIGNNSGMQKIVKLQ